MIDHNTKHDVKGKPALPFVYVPATNLPGVIAVPLEELKSEKGEKIDADNE